MTRCFLPLKKRLPATLCSLFTGVALAALVSSIIEAPVGSNDYLHDHLLPTATDFVSDWGASSSQLPFQDKLILSSIILGAERPDWTGDTDSARTGQALVAAKTARCSRNILPCNSAIRLSRQFNVEHINADLRVANVTEASLTLPISWGKEPADIRVGELARETRLFRFHQSQGGWTQTTSEVIETKAASIQDRDGRFSDRFATRHVGFNYYPASASWKEFWINFPIDEISDDLRMIQTLNGNAVRVFIDHDYFDQAETREQAAEKFRTLLDLCTAHDIRVIVTLFDLRPNYSLSNIAQDTAHIDQVLTGVASHPAILGIDIKNQANLDFDAWGEAIVKSWLTAMARYIQFHFSDLPVTVGWSHSDAALHLKDDLDFITYHEYLDPDGFAERLNAIQVEVGDKPVMITELGSTVWSPFRSTQTAEAHQASRLNSQLQQAAAASGVFVWTLNDFDRVGNDVVGRRPWRKAQQQQFGLRRKDGSARPAQHVFRAHAHANNSQ